MNSKKIAISQSNYIPWKGYFDLINMVDEFILYDDMQYTKRDWRNRNKIKTPSGSKWITIGVEVKGKYFQKINETKISTGEWSKKHWDMIKQHYSKSRYFGEYKDIFEELYLNNHEEYLSHINYKFIVTICKILRLDTKIRLSSEFELVEGKTEKLLAICRDCEADIYISGPLAKDYLEIELFNKENIKVEWIDYSDYPKYNQLYGDFEGNVSILDLLFNEGCNASRYMKSFNTNKI